MNKSFHSSHFNQLTGNTRKIRIGVVSPEFPPQIGGVERYAYEYVKALTGKGFEVTVFTRPHQDGEVENEDFFLEPSLQRDFKTDRAIVRTSPMDAWHVMNAAYAWVACETSSPVIVSVHGNDFLRPYLPLCKAPRPLPDFLSPAWLRNWQKNEGRKRTSELMQRGLEQASAILTNSRYTEKVFLEHFPHLKNRSVVGLVGVSAHLLNTPLIPRADGGPKRLITVSRLSEPRKNVHLIIEALARLKNDFDFIYSVIGDGEERPALQAQASSLGLRDRVRFLSRLSDDQLNKELSASDLFVLCSSILPTSHEGFGIVYLEANACGVPSLGARLAGAAEAIEEGNSGFFVDSPEVDQITAALRRFLSEEIRFNSKACREFAARFTWDAVVEKALPYYTRAGT